MDYRRSSRSSMSQYNSSRKYDSVYEANYYKSIENDMDKFCPENLISKYLEMEDQNPKLQKLKQQFSSNNSRRLNSIHDSIVYQGDTYSKFLNPDYQLFKKGENYAKNCNIIGREGNARHMNNFMKFKKERAGLWQSSITTIPGSKQGLKENVRKDTSDKTEKSCSKSRIGSRRNSDASSVLSNITNTTKLSQSHTSKQTKRAAPKNIDSQIKPAAGYRLEQTQGRQKSQRPESKWFMSKKS